MYLSNEENSRLIKNTISHGFNDSKLTLREMQIISLIAQGNSNKDIANALCISVTTVQTHRRNIHSKTKTKGAVALANFAFSKGLV